MNSTDGINWTKGFQSTIGGVVAFGNNRFIMFAEQPNLSSDGINWVAGAMSNFTSAVDGSAREFSFLNYGSGVFIASLDTNKFKISTDNGQSWQTSVGPAGCTAGNNTLIELLTGNGSAVFLTSNGSACVSSDGGKTWSLTPKPIAGASSRTLLKFEGGGSTGLDENRGACPKGTADEGHCQESKPRPRVDRTGRVRSDVGRAGDLA